MKFLRSRTHQIIDQFSESELETVWSVLEPLYCDLFMLRAIEEAQQMHRPGDTLTREEAIDLLPQLQVSQRGAL